MDIERLKLLIEKREAIDAEIIEAVAGKKERKSAQCSKCGSNEHTARNCTVVA